MDVTWPEGRRFAFTIFDDTDWATVKRVGPVYDLLSDLGMRTTKSVWMMSNGANADVEGDNCENAEYRNWVLKLQSRQFEIGLHNVAPVTSPRPGTIAGVNRFVDMFGRPKFVHCNHYGCNENLYWGSSRVSGWRQTLYNAATRWKRHGRYRGHVENDALFWGDICREHVSYLRNFVFDEINTLRICPEMPYHDPAKPFVNFWFASTNGASLRRFLANFTIENIDRLAAQRGLCIAYVHFAAGFVRDSTIDAEFQRRMEYLASRNPWVAPVSDVLDHLRGNAATHDRIIGRKRISELELTWLRSKLRKGTS